MSLIQLVLFFFPGLCKHLAASREDVRVTLAMRYELALRHLICLSNPTVCPTDERATSAFTAPFGRIMILPRFRLETPSFVRPACKLVLRSRRVLLAVLSTGASCKRRAFSTRKARNTSANDPLHSDAFLLQRITHQLCGR